MSINTQPGQQIIKEVLAKRRIGASDFFNAKYRPQHLVVARKEAMRRIHEELGYSSHVIGKIMHRDPSTVRYALFGRNGGKAATRTHKLVLRHLDPLAREVVGAIAKAEQVTVEILIAQWVGERATYEAHVTQELRP